MGFNVMKLTQLKPKYSEFKREHPEFMSFIKTTGGQNLRKGAVFSITITSPEGEKKTDEITLGDSDVELAETVKDIFR